jgi:hypothetical protein
MSIFRNCLIVLIITTWFTIAYAFNQQDFESVTYRSFSPSIVEEIIVKGNKGIIIFKKNSEIKAKTGIDYFSADKVASVYAIESARLFRDLPEMTALRMAISAPLSDGAFTIMDISRKEIESFYGITLSKLKGDLSAWRKKFIQVYDNKQSKLKFLSEYVKVHGRD